MTTARPSYDTEQTKQLKQYLDVLESGSTKGDYFNVNVFLKNVHDYILNGADPNVQTTKNNNSALSCLFELIMVHLRDTSNSLVVKDALQLCIQVNSLFLLTSKKPKNFAQIMMIVMSKAETPKAWSKPLINYFVDLIKEDASVHTYAPGGPGGGRWWERVLDRVSNDDARYFLREINKHYSHDLDLSSYVQMKATDRQIHIMPTLYKNIMTRGKNNNISFYSREKLEMLAHFAKEDLLQYISNSPDIPNTDRYAILKNIADDIVKSGYDREKVTNPLAFILLTPRYLTAVDRSSNSIILLDKLLHNHHPSSSEAKGSASPSPLGPLPQSFFTKYFSFFWTTAKPVEKPKAAIELETLADEKATNDAIKSKHNQK